MSQDDQDLRDAPARPLPPGAPARLQADRYGWALAVLPLAAAVLLAPLALLGLHRDWQVLLVLLASAGLVVLDRRDLVRSGRVPRAVLPSTAWFLLLPVYLRKRTRRLGQGPLQFWVSVGCAVAGPVVGTVIGVAAIATLAVATLPQADGVLPACNDPNAAQDVLGVFDTLGPAREAGVRGISLSGQEETGQGPGAVPKLRYCVASVLASNAREYAVDYTYEQRPDGIVIRLELRPED